MKVLLLEPGQLANEMDIPHELSEMQRIVGGTIQAIYPFPEQAAVVCNDEGLLLGLPLNRVIDTGIVVAGTCFICGLGEEDFTGLTPNLMDLLRITLWQWLSFADAANRKAYSLRFGECAFFLNASTTEIVGTYLSLQENRSTSAPGRGFTFRRILYGKNQKQWRRQHSPQK